MNTRFIWLSLEGRTFRFHNRCGICWTVERLVVSEEGLCSMYLTREIVQSNKKIIFFSLYD